jgi:sorting and assembly machinery component 37
MVLELHVWGPAFSLPSVDPQCLAAIAYVSQAVPRAEWVLVASSDPSLSPTSKSSSQHVPAFLTSADQLPALRNDNVWIGGFRNIVDFVSQLSNGRWSLDVDLEGIEKADCIAYVLFNSGKDSI